MLKEIENGCIEVSTIHPTLQEELQKLLLLNEKLNATHNDYDLITSLCSTYTFDETFTTYPLNRNRFVTFYCKGARLHSSETLLFYKFENENNLMKELLLLEEMFRFYNLDTIYLVFNDEDAVLNAYKFLHSFYSNEETQFTSVNYTLGCEKVPFLRFFSNSLYSRTE